MAAEDEGDEAGRRTKAKVQDDEASNQQARLRSIQHAWDEAIARRTASEDSPLAGGAQEQDRLRYYRIGVEQLLLELESLGERTDAEELWEKEDLGDVIIPVPDSIHEALADPQTRVAWGSDVPEQKTVHVVGLSSILDIDWPVRAEFTVEVGRAEEVRKVAEREPPRQVLDNALRTARKFLGETGLDVELDMSKPTLRNFDASRRSEQIDYEDVQGSPDL